MKSLTDLTELFLRRAEARLDKIAALPNSRQVLCPRCEGTNPRCKKCGGQGMIDSNQVGDLITTEPVAVTKDPFISGRSIVEGPSAGTKHSPGGINNQQLAKNKPIPAAMTEEELKDQDSRIMQMYKQREENKAKQKKLEQSKRDSEESEVENAEQASKEKIREVVAIHPEFESIMSFIEYLNDGGQDIFSKPQFEMLCMLHGLNPSELMTVLNAAGKFEQRTDRKVKLPSEVIQEAATQAGVDRQQLFQYLNTLAPESMPLGVAGIVEAWEYKGLSPHEIRIMKLREKQNRNKADDGESGETAGEDLVAKKIEASWKSNIKLVFDAEDIKSVDDKEAEEPEESSDTNSAKPWDKKPAVPAASAVPVASKPGKASKAPAAAPSGSSSSMAAPSVTNEHKRCTVDYSK